MSSPKPWYQSKTIKFNIGVAVAVMLAILGLPEFQAALTLLPDELQRLAGLLIPLIIAAVNVYLRTVTSQPIGEPSPDEPEQ